MRDRHPEETCFISTTPGLEPALDEEIRPLVARFKRLEGGVQAVGPAGMHRALNLHLRTASRVVLRIAEFPARDVPALQRGLSATPLGDYWRKETPLRVSVSTHRSRLTHTGELRQIAARTWGATLATLTPGREDEEGEADELLVQLRLEQDVCTVSVDTSGALLYRRGYRQEVSRAPLRETLASGLLMMAGYDGAEPLWDPMCGSGTIPIEAAWMALRRPPGRSRERFGFERFPVHDAVAWQEDLSASRAQEREKPRAAIYATDLNAGSLGTARRNSKRAEVQQFLRLERLDATKPAWVPQEESGLLIANLPYGKRVGDREDLQSLYAGLGKVLRERLPGWRAGLLVAEPGLEKHLGREPEDVFDILNGGIRCRFYVFGSAR